MHTRSRAGIASNDDLPATWYDCCRQGIAVSRVAMRVLNMPTSTPMRAGQLEVWQRFRETDEHALTRACKMRVSLLSRKGT